MNMLEELIEQGMRLEEEKATQARQEYEAAKARQKAQEKALTETAKRALSEALGEIWEMLAPFAKLEYVYAESYYPEVRWIIKHPKLSWFRIAYKGDYINPPKVKLGNMSGEFEVEANDWKAVAKYFLWLHRDKQANDEKEKVKQAYQGAYLAYLSAYEQARKANEQTLAAMQAEVDGEFTVWRLTYGVVAEDEDERFAGQYTVTVLAGEPDGQGFWPVLSDRPGRVQSNHYYHLVSLSGPQQRRVSEGVDVWSLHLNGDSYLLVNPNLRPEEVARIKAEARSRLVTLPTAPRYGDFGLDWLAANEVEDEVGRLIGLGGASSGEELPF